MKTRLINIISLTVVASIIIGCTGCQSQSSASSANTLSSWADGSEAKQSFQDYINEITTEGSGSYVPQEDRIAAFDLDGTLLCEKPYCLQIEAALYRINTDLANDPKAVAARDAFLNDKTKDYNLEHKLIGTAFEGMTPNECTDYVTNFIKTQNEEGYDNLKYDEALYQPMMEVIDCLKQNNFTIYLVSGTDSCILWSVADEALNMNRSNIIGSNFKTEGENQNGADGEYYNMEPNEEIVRTSDFIYGNLESNKVTQFWRSVGKRPLMMFGNSSGDFSMLNYAISNPNYKGYGMIIDHNDGVREYDYNNSDEIKGAAEKYGWQYVSMRDDFKTVYADSTIQRAS